MSEGPLSGDTPTSIVTGKHYYGEFDPGSGRTLAAGLIYASRTRKHLRV